MAVPRYKLQTTLHHHTDTITTLQFSPSESFLASGSENGVIIIFLTQSWKPIKRFIDASPVASLLWHPSFPKTLLCGFSSGDIHTACFEGNDTVRVLQPFDFRHLITTGRLGYAAQGVVRPHERGNPLFSFQQRRHGDCSGARHRTLDCHS